MQSIPQLGAVWETYWDQKRVDVLWPESYCAVRNSTGSTYYAALHYQIIAKICVANYFLYNIGNKSQPLCERCSSFVETVEHKFFTCWKVRAFWQKMKSFFEEYYITEDFTVTQVITGKTNTDIVNHAIVLGKAHIQNSDDIGSIRPFINKLSKDKETEKYVAILNGELTSFEKKWGVLCEL